MKSIPQTYTWNNYRCTYTLHQPDTQTDENLALLLIHPIGVGLSGKFWQRFAKSWFNRGQSYPLYNPDLLGCGDSDKPKVAYYPQDWANQLKYFLETEVKKPVIIVVQGALFPVAINLVQNPPQPNWIKGLVLSGPPAWPIMTRPEKPGQQKLLWNLFFNTPIGRLFYLYARRRQFIESFSIRQLFAQKQDVDHQWLDVLEKDAIDLKNRYAVFSFLSGFWRKNYEEAIASIPHPTLVVVGEKASSISREGVTETPEERLDQYLKHLPNGQGRKISGRNVPPYESTDEFVTMVEQFVNEITSKV
ncbi:conserved hypothetical protein [Gloeothece citriformis PCC 7424]|uniref:AB hydrolase-1 domain-containing protein n=1 Tax=Gloeothece citriformis (strain PCC 7424) TaxID=65393 RepID=B7KA37_GLOC7|nr:alpha/beta hydrolase [Gloeothece citriformis]ACK71393.1 conserved hypothetical protein [Gloeothece citriformis PCC 7424]